MSAPTFEAAVADLLRLPVVPTGIEDVRTRRARAFRCRPGRRDRTRARG
jgi:hypothetical protein